MWEYIVKGLENYEAKISKVFLSGCLYRVRLACYSLFLNRDPGDAPGKKGNSRDRLANPTSSLFHLYGVKEKTDWQASLISGRPLSSFRVVLMV